MLKNIFNKTKKIIKENYKSIIFFIILYIIFMWPLNYYIITGGGIMEIGNRIVVEDEYKSKGSFNLAYVNEAKGTITTYLLSYIIPNWERIKASSYTYDDVETISDVEFRGKIDLEQASSNAIKNAFLEAGKTYTVTDENLYVYYVDKDSSNNFKVGDKILKVDGKEIKGVDNFHDVLENYNPDEEIKVLVERNGRQKELTVKLYSQNGKNILGIYVSEVEKFKTYPKVTIKFKNSESGPSGGLMEALDIYNKITEKDLTKGLKVAGTGEIDKDGNIGTIGGVKYKLLGAEKSNADIFLTPKGENYKTCLKVKKQNHLKIKVISVSTLEEAINALEKYNK